MKKKTKVIGSLLATLTVFGAVAFGNTIASMSIRGEESRLSLAKSDVVIKSSTGTATRKVYDNIVMSNGSTTSSVKSPEEETTKPTTPTEKIYATVIDGPLNVRSGPGISYSVIGALNIGDKVEAVAQNNGWIKIKYGTSTAYISATYVTVNGNLQHEGILPESAKIKKVIIDAGHGGSDPGAIGPSKYQEKAFTLATTLKLKSLLESKGFTVSLTRATDIYLSLIERVDISNKSGADLFISIHANSFNATSNGVETFSYQPVGTAAEVAKLVQNRLIKNTGLTNRGHKTEGFYVLKHNNIPAILVEAAFISNPKEEALLKSEEFQNKIANSILEGILEY